MSTKLKRQTFRAALGIACLQFGLTAVTAAEQNASTPRQNAATHVSTGTSSGGSTNWQPLSQQNTIHLPSVPQSLHVALASGTSDAFNSGSAQVQFGVIHAVEGSIKASDPVPTSPWNTATTSVSSNRATASANNAAAATSASQPQQNSSTRFIQQPSHTSGYHAVPYSNPVSSPQSYQSTDESIPLHINAPLTGSITPVPSHSAMVQELEIAPQQRDETLARPVSRVSNTRVERSREEAYQNPQPISSLVSNEKSAANSFAEREVVTTSTHSGLAPTNVTTSYDLVSQQQSIQARQTAARMESARRISRDLLQQPKSIHTELPKPLESPEGWTAVKEQLNLHLSNCDGLLRRGAIQSARDEVLLGVQCLLRSIDTRTGDLYSEPAFDRAMLAFSEEEDFHTARSANSASSTPVAGHQTPVLKGVDTRAIAPLVAAQHYRAYARTQLVAASQGHPWAAELYYALGKTFEASAEKDVVLQRMHREQAICCFQAALEIRHDFGDAANQLGYSLLKQDRIADAEQALEIAESYSPTADVYRNLAELYRRRNDKARELNAAQRVVALESSNGTLVNGKRMPQVLELSPEQFASLSPNVTQPNPNAIYTASLNNGASQLQNNAPVPAAATVPNDQKPSLFQRWFR